MKALQREVHEIAVSKGWCRWTDRDLACPLVAE